MKSSRALCSRRQVTSQAFSVVLLVCATVLGTVGIVLFSTTSSRAEQGAPEPTGTPMPEARLAPDAMGGAPRIAAQPHMQATAVPTLTQQQKLQILELQLNAAWNAQDWVLAINLIHEIIAIDPNYDDIQAKRYYAHINYGYQFLAAHKCTEAKAQFTEAAQLRPSGEEAQTALSLLPTYCPTVPTPHVTHTPKPPPTSVVSPTPTPQTLTGVIVYTVQPGDTLFSLATRYGTTVQAIMQANGMMAPVLHAGEDIYIAPADAPSIGPIVHIVQPGETLRSIAEMYRTTEWAIMAANGMKHSVLFAYQAIFVPAPLKEAAIVHIVMPGETLFTIAEYYSTTVPLLMLANGLDTYSLQVYQLLAIPPQDWTGGPLPFPVPWADKRGPSHGPSFPKGEPAGERFYVVQRNDTLFSIARRYGTTVEAIQAANGLSGSTIYVGQKLRIP
jgi:LysM repeat protein